MAATGLLYPTTGAASNANGTWANMAAAFGATTGDYGNWSTSTASLASQYYFSGFDFSSIPSDATIDSVTLTVKSYVSSNTLISAASVGVYSNLTVISGTNNPTLTRSTSTTNVQTVTLTGLTRAHLALANFRVRLNVAHSSTAGAAQWNIDTVGLTVNYTPAATGTPTVYASDTFTGSDGAAWSSAWTSGNPTFAPPTRQITANRGRMLAPASYANHGVRTTATIPQDSEITGSFIPVGGNGGLYVRLYLRTTASSDAGRGYYIEVTPATNTFAVQRDGSASTQYSGGATIASSVAAGFTWTSGTEYAFRFQAITESTQVAIRAKVWPAGTSEPTTWNFSGADTSSDRLAGVTGTDYAGLRVTGGGTANYVDFDNIVVQSPTTGAAAPATQTVTGVGALGATNAFGSIAASLGTAPTTVDPTNLYKGSQQVDNFLAANPELAPIAAQPAAKWINVQSDADNIPALVTAAAGKTLLLSVYAIPGRDNGQYSAGGFPDRSSYLSFITSIKNNLGNAPAIISYEADALGLTNGMSASVKAERIETLRQAINILATIPNTETYVDASQWIAVADQGNMLQAVDVAKIHGFSLNTSGYEAQADCYAYGNNVLANLAGKGITGKKFIVDSSRNGNGALKAGDANSQPWIDAGLAWCNPPGRAIGLNPGTVSEPNCRATFWIKAPGESDGTFPTTAQSAYYGENAPSAGAFWLPQARSLLGLSPQKSGAVAASFAENAKADFSGGFGALVDNGELTLVNGRARLPITTNYPYAGSAVNYTVVGNTHHVELIPGPVVAGSTEQWVQFIIESSSVPSSTRVRFQVDVAGGIVQMADDVNYYDPGQVTLPYDATTMRWLRFRESGGTLFWETSPDGRVWTTRRSNARPSWMTSTANQKGTFATHCGVGSSYVEIDNLNVVPADPNITVSVPSLGSTNAFGSLTVATSTAVPVASRASTVAFGPLMTSTSVTAAVPTLAATNGFGAITTSTSRTATPTSLASANAFGSITTSTTVTVAVPSLGSTAAIGQQSAQTLLSAMPTSAASTVAFGTLTAVPGPISVTVPTLASTARFGALVGIAGPVSALVPSLTSTASYGTLTASPGPVTVLVPSLASTASTGLLAVSPGSIGATPNNIASATAFGPMGVETPTPVAIDGIASTNAFGLITARATITVAVPSRASTAAFGTIATSTSVTASVAPRTSTVAFGTITTSTSVARLVPSLPSTASLGQVTAAPGSIAVPVPSRASTTAFGSIAATASITATPNSAPSQVAFGQTAAAPGSTAVAVPSLGPTAQVSTPGAILADNQATTPTSVASTARFGAIATSTGPVSRSMTSLVSVNRFGPITTATTASQTPSSLPSGAAVGAITVSTTITVPVPSAPATTSFGAVTGTPGVISALPLSVPSGASIGQPVGAPGSRVVAMTSLAPTSAVGQVQGRPGSISRTPTSRSSTAGFGPVATSTSITVPATPLDNESRFGEITATSVVTVSMPALASTVSVSRVDIAPGEVAVVLESLVNTNRFGEIGQTQKRDLHLDVGRPRVGPWGTGRPRVTTGRPQVLSATRPRI